MSLAEIEKKVRALPAPERLLFVSWVLAHEEELVEPSVDPEIAPEVMEEVLRRRRELDEANVQTYSLEEVRARVQASLDEVHGSGH